MTNKKYVALVTDLLDWISLNPSYESIRIHLLAPGPLHNVPGMFQESSMSVPVAPSIIPHPLGRKALPASHPLPWTNCHHSAFAMVDVRARSAWTNAPASWHFDQSESGLYHEFLDVDHQRSQTARETHAAGIPPLPSPPQHIVEDDSWWELEKTPSVDPDFQREIYHRYQFPELAPDDLGAEEGPGSEDWAWRILARRTGGLKSEGPDSDIDLDLEGALLGLMLPDRPSKEPPLTVINVSYDLGELAAINDPGDFFKELELLKHSLRRLQEMSKQRTSDRAQLSAETRTISEKSEESIAAPPKSDPEHNEKNMSA
ncbi:hypothetical protein DFH09DRAFT_1499140 [Mycena vulgaris]|nr:hypothetical protein DFH09DRAFT_1499140 [Mycena vulgaris]